MLNILLRATFLVSVTAASAAIAAPASAPTPTLTVLSSGGIMGAIRAAQPGYEKAYHVKLDIQASPSMGETPQAVPNRLARHEPADVILMVGSALDSLQAKHLVVPASRVDLGESYIAMAVRKGEPKPDISTMENLRNTLLDSQSVAYSDSASGVYLSETLFPSMALGEAFKAKAHMIPAEPVGAVVARGQAQVGFQQLSELKPVSGIDIVGLIPAQAQKMTLYAGAVVSTSTHQAQAKQLLDYLASAQADTSIQASGLKPLDHAAKP